MFSKIASITLPIFTLALVEFLYSRGVKMDENSRKKLFPINDHHKAAGA
jgi:hypothetical protein